MFIPECGYRLVVSGSSAGTPDPSIGDGVEPFADEVQGVLPKRRISLDFSRCGPAESGSTLVELIVVMALLAVILAALVGGFTTAIRAEVDQTARANDRESAREALERMRKDIHCASGAADQPTLDALGNPTGTGYTLQLAVTQSQCLGVTTASNGVQWCSVSVGGGTKPIPSLPHDHRHLQRGRRDLPGRLHHELRGYHRR